MPKPTLLQTILHQPSRSYLQDYPTPLYTFEQGPSRRRSYDGTNSQFRRSSTYSLAGPSNHRPPSVHSDLPSLPLTSSLDVVSMEAKPRKRKTSSSKYVESKSRPISTVSVASSASSYYDARSSIATQEDLERLARSQATAPAPKPVRHTSTSPPVANVDWPTRIEEEWEDEDEDVFVTPPSSPPQAAKGLEDIAMAKPRVVKGMPPLTAALVVTAHTPAPSPPLATMHQASRSQPSLPSITENIATRPSLDEELSDDSMSTSFSPSSSYAPSQTTAPTSAAPSTSSHKLDWNSPGGSSRPEGSRRRSMGHRRSASTSNALEGDWAKEVKWLGSSTEQSGRPQSTSRNWTHTPYAKSTSSLSSTSSFNNSPRRRSLDSAADSEPPPIPPKSLSRSNSVGSSSQRRPRPRMTAHELSALMIKRMSDVLEVDDEGEVIGSAPQSRRPPSEAQRSLRHKRSISLPSASKGRPPSVHSKTSTTSYQTVEIPSILDVSSGQPTYQNGFTSLTLPRAAQPPPKRNSLLSGTVDLQASGKAQATMGTISIIKGGSTVAPVKRRSLWRNSSLLSRKGKEIETPERLQTGVDAALGFNTWTATPSKYGPSEMIVKVYAIAIGDADRLLVRTKLKSGKASDAYGFIPGRSFVGKVLETGWEVNDVRRGDWVMGLMEFYKSGALAEHVVIDRTRVARAPKPDTELWPGGTTLTIEQVAVLPLLGVASHRAVKTFPQMALNHLRLKNKKGKAKEELQPRVLVLGAHTDVGFLVVQEFALRQDMEVSVLIAPGTDQTKFFGVAEILQGDADEVLQKTTPGLYMMIVDCVGGERLWKTAKRVLDTRCGQFTTTIGDDPLIPPTRQAYTKSSMRSLRHSFIRSGGKTIGYEWICPVIDVDLDGGDVRTTLTEVTKLAEQGLAIPPISRIVAFERGMDVFKDGETGTTVVKVVE